MFFFFNKRNPKPKLKKKKTKQKKPEKVKKPSSRLVSPPIFVFHSGNHKSFVSRSPSIWYLNIVPLVYVTTILRTAQ